MSGQSLEYWEFSDIRDGICYPHIHVSYQGYVHKFHDGMIIKLRRHHQEARREASFMYHARECSAELIALVLNVPHGGGGLIMRKHHPIIPASFTVQMKLSIMYDMRQTLQELHGRGILHGDVKLSNILLDDNSKVRFCDFGSAIAVHENLPPYTLSRRYCSPHRLGDGAWSPLTTADDFYSLGCTVWELFTGRIPFDHIDDVDEVARQIVNGVTPNVYDVGNEEAINFIRDCWRLPE